jgi:NAD(P)-dependent dehydrogenase (short-subunit alcohol dehydrogenase family)
VSRSEASALLRPGLLRGTSVLLAGGAGDSAPEGSVREAVRGALQELGALVRPCEVITGAEAVAEGDIEAAVSAALTDGARIGMLVLDGAGVFAAADGGRVGLRVCLESAWSVTRALVNAAFIPGGEGGRIVYIAPPPRAGAHADAARAGLENLARTLSVEWARHGITAVTIAPGDASSPSQLAALTAYLASEAGAYFSGCLLDLAGRREPPSG